MHRPGRMANGQDERTTGEPNEVRRHGVRPLLVIFSRAVRVVFMFRRRDVSNALGMGWASLRSMMPRTKNVTAAQQLL